MEPVVAQLPFDHVAMDFIVVSKTSERGFNYILLILDIASRFVLLRALKSKEAQEVAWVLLLVFSDFGFPKILQCDNDRSFINTVMEKLRETAEFKWRKIMEYFLNQNGAPERWIREVKKLIAKWL